MEWFNPCDGNESDEGGNYCVICNASVCESDIGTGTQFKVAFGLFCKLANITVPLTSRTSANCGDGDGVGSDVPACDLCSGTLREIIKLERIIEDLKISQMFHVNTLKRSLMIELSASSNRAQKMPSGCRKGGVSGAERGLIRNQLINCLQEQQGSASSQSSKRTLSPPTKTQTSKRLRGHASHRNRNAGVSPSQLKSGQFALKTCTVKLTRLAPGEETRTTTTPASHLKGRTPASTTRPARQGKLKSYDILRSATTSQGFQDKTQIDNCDADDEEAQMSSPENDHEDYFEDNSEDFDFLPAPEDIKQELGVDKEDEEWAPGDLEHDPNNEAPVEGRLMSLKTPPPMLAGKKLKNIYLLADNLYLYRYTVIKFCPSDRHFICLDPDCPTPQIPGSLLDCSILENIKSHVTTHHNTGITSDIKLRSCIICRQNFHGSPLQYRMHLVESHTNKRRNMTTVLCETCARPLDSTSNLEHFWTHKNFDDKVAAITTGECVPYTFKKLLRKRKHDPLYPLVFDKAGNEKDVKKVIELPENYEKIRKYFNPFYVINNDATKLFHNYSLISVEDGHKLICKEPGCDMAFQADKPLDFEGLFDKVKDHVRCCHDNELDAKKICPMCGVAFQSGILWRHHLLTDHEDKTKKAKTVICQICGMPVLIHAICRYRDHIFSHMSAQEQIKYCNDMAARTDQSKKSKLRFAEMASNLAAGLEPNQVSCEKCGKVYGNMKGLKAHISVAHVAPESRRKWVCSRCGKEYFNQMSLKAHVETIHEPQFQKCPVEGCGRRFHKRDGFKLKNHLLRHKGQAPCICDYCGKGFYAKAELKTHQDHMHLDRRYQCDDCGISYKTKSALNKHKSTDHHSIKFT